VHQLVGLRRDVGPQVIGVALDLHDLAAGAFPKSSRLCCDGAPDWTSVIENRSYGRSS
jgi:hypothetical protein